jgi:glycosyltransferase involved in cell wall biosynthesis
MSGHYGWADVFVLPSLCEGSATVCYEALASGLPVITTPNAGSVVRDGIDGFIVPIRDAEAIAARLEMLISDPRILDQMSGNAALRAAEFTVKKYGERLLSTVQSGLFNRT